ncbi:3-hexulose-6-phosphate isomerase [Geobacillus sp. BCO2]|nr:3-hexulose-6-phosphate isomerase [Geobacillus sp. BCO2]
MNLIETIFLEIEQVFSKFEHRNIEYVVACLQKAKRIFVTGEGRSGLMGKAFAMRLMHLGAMVYVVGETVTPSIQSGDTLIAISGSGETKQTVWIAEKARQLGCKVIAFTANLSSDLAETASFTVYVPAATKYRHRHEMSSQQP